MAPQRPESKHRSRPSSGAPSPTKSSPRKSGDKRRSRDPDSERKRDSRHSETKRRSRAEDDPDRERDRERRRERERNRDRESADEVREKRRSGHGSPRKDGSPRKERTPRKSSPTKKAAIIVNESEKSSNTGSNGLSLDSLAKLNAMNEKETEKDQRRRERERDKEKVVTGRVMKERHKHRSRRDSDVYEKSRPSKRVISGGTLERGLNQRGGFLQAPKSKKKKIICGVAILIVLLLVIFIPVGVVVANKKKNNDGGGSSGEDATPSNSNLDDIDPASIPSSAKGSYLDPFTWYDTDDFNLTYTAEEVGGLPIMGLYSKWDDSKRANEYVPPLDKEFKYGEIPIRGVNVGGWLALEPFITPSLFDYAANLNIVDEWTLTKHLGPSGAAKALEKHYSTWINKQSFKDIQAAGFDHVRIPFSYWALKTYDGDPFVPKISWRYLLRGIEYARECGLRVKLDVHGLPGSQNGWNHSGKQGPIGWLNGTDGTLNGQRSLDMHDQLSQFFAQPRYKNVVAIYGLVNEPKMISLVTATVLEWTQKAVDIARKNGISQWIAFGDGFLGIPNWKGKLQGIDRLMMDAHQYVIFNTDQLAFDHKTKLNFACDGWSGQMQQSMNKNTGFGPTICGEWSQADTDCTPNLNNVGTGSRWEGTLNLPDPSSAVLQPSCPTKDRKCSCDGANADAAEYSDEYKQWLLYNAEAQMTSFEKGYGWFYWTWRTESAVQWSWKLGMEAGILPKKTWEREFNCTEEAPGFDGLAETY